MDPYAWTFPSAAEPSLIFLDITSLGLVEKSCVLGVVDLPGTTPTFYQIIFFGTTYNSRCIRSCGVIALLRHDVNEGTSIMSSIWLKSMLYFRGSAVTPHVLSLSWLQPNG